MKRYYQNETIVDFQGRSTRQQADNNKMGCFMVILFIVVIIVMILINTFNK